MAAIENTLHTKNILLALKEHADRHNTPLKKLDFTLLGVQSYFKTIKHESFIKFHEDYKADYTKRDLIIQEHVRFLQLYKIKIHPRVKRNIHLVYRLEMGEFATYPILVLSPESRLPLSELGEQEMLKLLYGEFNKIKALKKMLVNLFSSCMIKDLKSFVAKLYSEGFTQEESFLLFEGIDPEIAKPSKVINHYKNKIGSEKVSEVEESELIITYEKPIYGETGLNAYGQRIAHGDINNHAKIEFQVDAASVSVQENKSEIRYYAKKRGFVSLFNNLLSISNKIVVQQLNRTEGKLTHKEENEVAVFISQNDVTRDGVGEGVELISESVHITGHMGAKSSIEAKEVVIDGATHTETFITVRDAKINRHKGTLRCHKAEINSLEGGTVYATHVHINTAMGGKIFAEHVTIKTLKHNLKVFASKTITIERLLGEDNHLIIDYRKLPIVQTRLQYLNDEYDDLKWKCDEAKKHSPQKLESLKEELQSKEEEINAIKLSHYDAIITIMAPVNGLNTIEFAIPEKQTSLIYRTKEPKTFEPFYLHKTEERISLKPVGIKIDL